MLPALAATPRMTMHSLSEGIFSRGAYPSRCMSTASSTRNPGSHERRYHTVSSVCGEVRVRVRVGVRVRVRARG